MAGTVVAILCLGVWALYAAYVPWTVGVVMSRRRRSRRAQALRRLAALPFPLEHDPRSAVNEDTLYHRAILGATVRFASPVDGVALQRAAMDAQALAPGLVVTIENAALVMTAWPWRGDDLHLLVELLSTWGNALHAEHPIARVSVRWEAGGPPCEM